MKYQNTCTKCYVAVGGGKSNDKLNADSSHTNMLVIFVNYSINFSLTTKMNHNEIKKKSLSFPFDAAMDWQHARRGPCLRPNVSRPKLYIYIYIISSLLFPYVFVSCSQ